jgi:serine protease Do
MPASILSHALAADALVAGALATVTERLRRTTVAVRPTAGPVRAAARDDDGGGDDQDGGGGAGILWPAHGGPLVVTNAHVATAPRARVTLADGRTLAAEVVRRDPGHDLAALRLDVAGTDVDAAALPSAEIGDPRVLRPGDLVLAVGHPLGVRDALALGVLHARDAMGPGRRAWVRADIRLAPGNSGGPLADAEGRVVGVNAMIVGGLGYAVPSLAVQRFLRHAFARPTLGLRLRTVAVRHAGAVRPGLLVIDLAPGGPAERAGVLVGDVVIAAAGRAFDGPDALLAALEETSPGDALALELVRGGRAAAVEVVVGGTPASRAA